MIKDLFPTKIYKVSYDKELSIIAVNLQKIINFDITIKNNQGSMRGNGICSYVERRDLHTLDEFKGLVNFINKHVQRYWQEINYDPCYKPYVEEMWYNVYKKDAFIDIHNHAPRVMTASFYVTKESGNSNIIFENPMSLLLKHQPYYINKDLYHTEFEQEVDAQSGDLIIFPGWLNHKSVKNNSDADRIMIGAHICIDR